MKSERNEIVRIGNLDSSQSPASLKFSNFFKMYKYILEQAGNINWMAIFALLTFMFIFITSVVVVFFKSKKSMDRMANLPLEED